MNSAETRMPPHNLAAEQSVLGGLMIEINKVDDIAPLIRADDFYHEANRIIFTTMLAMRDAGKPVNTISLLRKSTVLVGRMGRHGERRGLVPLEKSG